MERLEDPTEERLRKIWQEGAQDIARAFLKRAIGPDMTLADLQAALNFDAVRGQLDHIRLGDVMPRPAPRAVAAAPALVRETPGPKRRKRQGAKAAKQVKMLVLEQLKDANHGITSPELGAKMKARGYPTDSAKTYQLLASMQTAGHIVGGGRAPQNLEDYRKRSASPARLTRLSRTSSTN